MKVLDLCNTCINWKLVRILTPRYNELTTDFKDAEELKVSENINDFEKYHYSDVSAFTVEPGDYDGIELNIWI